MRRARSSSRFPLVTFAHAGPARTRGRATVCGPAAVILSSSAAGELEVAEVHRDDAVGVGAEVVGRMNDRARAVGPCQVERVGVVLDVVLVVAGLPEPAREVTRGGDAARVVGCEGRRTLVRPGHPELVAIGEEGGVEHLVCSNRRQRARRPGAWVGHRHREQHDVVVVRGHRHRSLPTRGSERCSRAQRAHGQCARHGQ
jgi:hypothetical protein